MRLLDARDFARVFQRPSKSSGPAVTVLARSNGCQAPRLGLAIARKEVRRAVQRNRLKRLIRESFRHHQALLHGLDVIVVARRGLVGKSSQAVFRCLEKHWREVSERCRRDPPAGTA